LKRKNFSTHTVKNYLSCLKHFVIWLDVPIEQVTNQKVLDYIDLLIDKRLKPKTINCQLDSIRGFYEYLRDEERLKMDNPVKRGYALKLSQPLPKHLRDEEVGKLLAEITGARDRAMFMLMLRSGLRVEEVCNLSLAALDLRRRRVYVLNGKGAKDRVAYMSRDCYEATVMYLRLRPASKARKVFLVERGLYRGKPISVRGIQKRMEYYAKTAGLKVSCHHLRHTMATQMLNADADLVTIQDLLGHSRIKTTQRYSKVSNLKVERDYHRAMEKVMERTA